VRSTAFEGRVLSGVRKGTVFGDGSCFVGVARVGGVKVEVLSGVRKGTFWGDRSCVRKGTFWGDRSCFIGVEIVGGEAASPVVRSTHSMVVGAERSMQESSRRTTGSASAARREARAWRLEGSGVAEAMFVAVGDVDDVRRSQTLGWLLRGSEEDVISVVRWDNFQP
jgi:hypothetical protein